MLTPTPGFTFEVREKRITFYFFDNFKLLLPVEAGKHNVSGLEAKPLSSSHDRGFCIEPVKCKLR